MRIDDNRHVLLRYLKAGSVFDYKGTLYVKTDSDELSAMAAEDGSLEHIDLDTNVEYLSEAVLCID